MVENCCSGLLLTDQAASCALANASSAIPKVPANTFHGELISFPGPWGLRPEAFIILISDENLRDLSDPDKILDLSYTYDKYEDSLRRICEKAKAAGRRTLAVIFDEFYSQYRSGQDSPRTLTPDMDEYVERMAAISEFVSGYGLGLNLSLLNPLEIGPAYTAKTGESGRWMQYRKGLRDPKTGTFSVEYWQQKRWVNNKGKFLIEDASIRVFAFREDPVNGTPYRVVDPSSIVEITDAAKLEYLDSGDNPVRRRVRVCGSGKTEIGDLDRVFVVQQYTSPEMDYFSDNALPFLKNLMDKYVDAGVKLNGLYSDEMHIQQDWNYWEHHDNGEFTLRYVSRGLEKKFAEKFGAEYEDFAKYMIYFVYGQEDFSPELDARMNGMHVFGSSPEEIRRTALFRSRYYHLLQDHVVDLCAEAKHYAEQKIGHSLDALGQATWAESPTIDFWQTGQENMHRNQYEYTSNFVWSNTVHQAASACYDYFKWGDYITGNGHDHAEAGWLDRDYFALALGCSTGIINDVPYSYSCHLEMPAPINERRYSVSDTYGVSYHPRNNHEIVQEMQHRDVNVLMLYPMDLVAVEERFGSWMTQYGYTNYITQAKLLELGKVENGAIEMAGRRFTTLVATFEPFPSKKLLEMMRRFVETGGRLIWSGPPPALTSEGDSALYAWQKIFGVSYSPGQNEGSMAPGRRVEFTGVLSGVQPQIILTDMLVDHIYPVSPMEGTGVAATVKGVVAGTHHKWTGGGSATFLGYRPRDDQSASLGYETRNWFEVLHALGAYPGTGKFPDTNDNTEYISRTTEYLTCRFPNGAVSVTRHLRNVEEDWAGNPARNQKEDAEYLKRCPPPSDELHLKDFAVNGYKVTYDGAKAVTFRVDEKGELVGFSGNDCRQITIDGKTTVFADKDLAGIAWSPVSLSRRVEHGAEMQITVKGIATVRIPAGRLPEDISLFVEGTTPGSRGEFIPSRREGDCIVFESTPEISGRWIYVVPGAPVTP